jgi:hypothetical protein
MSRPKTKDPLLLRARLTLSSSCRKKCASTYKDTKDLKRGALEHPSHVELHNSLITQEIMKLSILPSTLPMPNNDLLANLICIVPLLLPEYKTFLTPIPVEESEIG